MGEVEVYDSHGFSFHPTIPTASDSISLAISGEFPSTGYSFARRLVTMRADTISVDVQTSFAGGPQLDEIIPWSVRACLPPQPAGVVVVSITTAQATVLGTVVRNQQIYPISVVATHGPAPMDIAWAQQGSLSEILGIAQAGTRHTVGIVPTSEWSGESTQLWLSFDPSVTVADQEGSWGPTGCQSWFRRSDPSQAVVEIQCSSWEASLPVFSFEVNLLDSFPGWADIRLDSLEIQGLRQRVGDTARLVALAVGRSSLGMDFDGDRRVDFDDFFIFADAFGSQNSFFDFNASGRVDFDDFFLFADQFGKTWEPERESE